MELVSTRYERKRHIPSLIGESLSGYRFLIVDLLNGEYRLTVFSEKGISIGEWEYKESFRITATLRRFGIEIESSPDYLRFLDGDFGRSLKNFLVQ